MKLPLIALLALAGCPKRGGGGTGPTETGAGCPTASSVYLTSYLQAEGGKGHWVLPLHDKLVPSVEGVADYARIDAAAATAAGVPQPPSSLWLLLPNAEPCKATIGSYYAAAITEGAPNMAYGVELSGCAAPPKEAVDASAIAVVSEAIPSGCKVVAPRPVASRLGETDAQGAWSAPKKETPIPAELAKIVPPKECAAPACEKLWSVAQVDVGGKPVAWAAAINWLTVGEAGKQCEWPVEKFSGFFVAGADGTPVKVTEGQDHPLALVGVLADSGGAKVLFASGPGEYTAYDLGASGATVGRHLVWLVPHEESFAETDRLGPECGL